MRVVIAGGSGFLGSALARQLSLDGHEVMVLTREGGSVAHGRAVQWHPNGASGPWARDIDGADAIVNLAGAGIADKRWTPARKKLLEDSRVLSTRSLIAALREISARSAIFVQGSAVGHYGAHQNGPTFDENSPPGDDFLARLAVRWETEAAPAAELGWRLTVVRSGVVLARDDGALPQMARPFHFFVGGPVASGRQQLSWIHVDDWVALVTWALTNPQAQGPLNATAPEPVTNREFSAAVGRALHRPSWAPVPAFVLNTLFGEMADTMLVRGQRVIPSRALAGGFVFRFERVNEALSNIYGGR